MTGTQEPSISKHNGNKLTPSLTEKSTPPMPHRKPTLRPNQHPMSIHMPWMWMQSKLKNSPGKRGKDASKKEDAFDAESPDIS